MKAKLLMTAVVAGIFTIVSCKKDSGKEPDKPQNEDVKEVKNLNVSSNDWVYYSFEGNKTVAENESWDVAFRQYDIKTKEGVLNTKKKNFEEVKEAPSDGYITDIERYTFQGRVLTKNVSSPVISMGYSEYFWQFITERGIINNIPEGEREAVKATLVHDNGWQTFSYAQGGPSFQNNGWIYVVKMANGKFAKVHLTSFTDDKNAPFFVTFKYKISKDGKF